MRKKEKVERKKAKMIVYEQQNGLLDWGLVPKAAVSMRMQCLSMTWHCLCTVNNNWLIFFHLSWKFSLIVKVRLGFSFLHITAHKKVFRSPVLTYLYRPSLQVALVCPYLHVAVWFFTGWIHTQALLNAHLHGSNQGFSSRFFLCSMAIFVNYCFPII